MARNADSISRNTCGGCGGVFAHLTLERLLVLLVGVEVDDEVGERLEVSATHGTVRC